MIGSGMEPKQGTLRDHIGLIPFKPDARARENTRRHGGDGQSGAPKQKARKRGDVAGLPWACPVSRRLLRGGFNHGLKRRSAR